MKAAVRYFTRSGNMKKLAEAIAAELGVAAQDVSVPLEEHTDAVFLCNAMYGGGVDSAVKTFVKDNAPKIGRIVNVSTAAVAASTYKLMDKLAQESGVALAQEEFHCRGAFLFMHRNRPDADDLQKAARFAREIVSSL